MSLLPSKPWGRALLGLGAFTAFWIGYWVIYHFSRDGHRVLFGDDGIRGGEDHLVEWLGFGGFLVAGIFSLMTWKHRSKMPKWVAFYFLGLSAFYLFCAGEEISWGQRIFGWETPESYAEINMQDETNLHNLDNLPFHPKDIVSWFMKMFGIGFPIIFYYAFKKRDHLYRRLVAPLSLVPLFIFVEVFNKLEKPFKPIAREWWDPAARRLVINQHEEIMEMYWELCVAFAAIGLWLYWRKKGKEPLDGLNRPDSDGVV